MTTILCPTRGGKESQPNQDFAIEYAKEHEAKLIFLYVFDTRLIGRAGPPIVVDIDAELDEVGDFVLLMAQERAKKAGLLADVAVRHGIFLDVLETMIAEKGVTTVILGSSPQASGVITDKHLQVLGDELTQKMGVEFIVVQNGKEVIHSGIKE